MNENTMGMVLDIQKFSLHDGPGIRTTVFLKGCPLGCEWCHNPESMKNEQEIAFTQKNCIGCKGCYNICKTNALTLKQNKRHYDKSKCTGCGQCVDVCPGGALRWLGRKMSAKEVFDNLAADIPYYQNSGGGVTLSGGEPLTQTEFSAAILALAREAGLGTAIETSLFQIYENIRKLIPVTDMFFCDLKLIDDEAHKEYVGVSNELILANLIKLYDEKKQVTIHTPLIPGITDSGENIRNIAVWMKRNIPDANLELLNYNPLARAKWENLNMVYEPGEMKPLREETIKELAGISQKEGITTTYRMG